MYSWVLSEKKAIMTYFLSDHQFPGLGEEGQPVWGGEELWQLG